MARGPNGAWRTDRRSQPAPPDQRGLRRGESTAAGWANGSTGCACAASCARDAIRWRRCTRLAWSRFLVAPLSDLALAAFAAGSMVTGGPPSVAILVEKVAGAVGPGAGACSGTAAAAWT